MSTDDTHAESANTPSSPTLAEQARILLERRRADDLFIAEIYGMLQIAERGAEANGKPLSDIAQKAKQLIAVLVMDYKRVVRAIEIREDLVDAAIQRIRERVDLCARVAVILKRSSDSSEFLVGCAVGLASWLVHPPHRRPSCALLIEPEAAQPGQHAAAGADVN